MRLALRLTFGLGLALAACTRPITRGTAEGIGGGDPVLNSLRGQRVQLAAAAGSIAAAPPADLCSVSAIQLARPEYFRSFPQPSEATVTICRSFFTRYAADLARIARDEAASPVQLLDSPLSVSVNEAVSDVLAVTTLGRTGPIQFFIPRLHETSLAERGAALAHELVHQLAVGWDYESHRFVDNGGGIPDANGIALYPALFIELAAHSLYAVAYQLSLHDDALGDLFDFGGAYGFYGPANVARTPGVQPAGYYPNPITHYASCPTGYTAVQFLGGDRIDWDAFVCLRPHLPGRQPDYDFGGMFGIKSENEVHPNPATGDTTCPQGYQTFEVLHTPGVDNLLFACYREHRPGARAALRFGGILGFYEENHVGKLHPNPATNGATCPKGYREALIFEAGGVDYLSEFCY